MELLLISGKGLTFYNGARLQLHIISIEKIQPSLGSVRTTFRKIAAERAVFFSIYAIYEDVPL